MSKLDTLLHRAAYNDWDFDIDYYYSICREKKVVDLCAGFGRVCNKLYNKGIDITAIELDEENFKFIELPENKKFNKNIFDCFDMESMFDVVIAPFNSFPMFYDEKSKNLFFELISKMLKPNGLISLSYYHPDSWRDVPPGELTVTIDNKKYEYTSEYNLSSRSHKKGQWVDIFTESSSKKVVSRTEYLLPIYENADDVNNICKKHDLTCCKTITDFYNPDDCEPGWVEYQLVKS